MTLPPAFCPPPHPGSELSEDSSDYFNTAGKNRDRFRPQMLLCLRNESQLLEANVI